MIAPHLRLHPDQQALTRTQAAEARRFAEVWIAAQLATSPVDEPEAETLLKHVYTSAGFPPPSQISWVDGPLQLEARLAPLNRAATVQTSIRDSIWGSRWFNAWKRIQDSVTEHLGAGVVASVRATVWGSVAASVQERVWGSVQASVRDSAEASVRNRIRISPAASNRASVWWVNGGYTLWPYVRASMRAYVDAPWVAFHHFFAVYLAPNPFHALAHFNALVSGYWLSQETAILVRRPCTLALDTTGRLHRTAGTCIEYHDGWSFST